MMGCFFISCGLLMMILFVVESFSSNSCIELKSYPGNMIINYSNNLNFILIVFICHCFPYIIKYSNRNNSISENN